MSANDVDQQALAALAGRTFPATAKELAVGFADIYNSLPSPPWYGQPGEADRKWEMACRIYHDALGLHFGQDARYLRP